MDVATTLKEQLQSKSKAANVRLQASTYIVIMRLCEDWASRTGATHRKFLSPLSPADADALNLPVDVDLLGVLSRTGVASMLKNGGLAVTWSTDGVLVSWA